jgi:hypothetical protein
VDEHERSASERQLGSTGMELPESAAALVQRIRELATQQVVASEHIVQATDAQLEAMQALNTECQTLLAREHAARGMASAALVRARASEAHFEQLVAANLIGVIVVEADRITEANDAFLRQMRATRRRPKHAAPARRSRRTAAGQTAAISPCSSAQRCWSVSRCAAGSVSSSI